jgi:hypothetical protein
MLKGFISGLYAGNYDITHIFIDNLFKAAGKEDMEAAGEFLKWLESFGKKNNVAFTVTISASVDEATDNIKKYF